MRLWPFSRQRPIFKLAITADFLTGATMTASYDATRWAFYRLWPSRKFPSATSYTELSADIFGANNYFARPQEAIAIFASPPHNHATGIYGGIFQYAMKERDDIFFDATWGKRALRARISGSHAFRMIISHRGLMPCLYWNAYIVLSCRYRSGAHIRG